MKRFVIDLKWHKGLEKIRVCFWTAPLGHRGEESWVKNGEYQRQGTHVAGLVRGRHSGSRSGIRRTRTHWIVYEVH